MELAQVADFVAAFGEEESLCLSNPDNPEATEVNGPIIERALRRAADRAGSYITAAGYCLPLSVVPGVLKDYVLDIARYQLEHINARDDVRKRYEDAIRWLEKLAAGKVDLGVPCGVDATIDAVQGTAAPVYHTNCRVHTDQRLRNYTSPRSLRWY